MSFVVKPARRGNVRILCGLAGPSGGGKTYTALELARGLAGDDGNVIVIDSEHGRSQIYADVGAPWEWMDFEPPFSPERYVDALKAAVQLKPSVIVIDSISHEYEGEGGLFDIVEEHLQAKAGDDARRRSALSFQAWNVAKQRHKKLMLEMLRLPCHLLVCMRAQDKIDLIKEGGQLKAVPKKSLTGLDGWVPICERRLPFDMTCSFLFLPDKPGIPRPLKPMPPTMAPLVPLDRPLGRKVGADLREWAAGAGAPGGKRNATAPSEESPKLVTELLSLAADLDMRDAVAARIGSSRSTYLGKPAEFDAWLTVQIERATEALAKKREAEPEIDFGAAPVSDEPTPTEE